MTFLPLLLYPSPPLQLSIHDRTPGSQGIPSEGFGWLLSKEETYLYFGLPASLYRPVDAAWERKMNGREKAGEDADRRRNEAAAGEGDEVQKTQYTSNQTPQIFHPGVSQIKLHRTIWVLWMGRYYKLVFRHCFLADLPSSSIPSLVTDPWDNLGIQTDNHPDQSQVKPKGKKKTMHALDSATAHSDLRGWISTTRRGARTLWGNNQTDHQAGQKLSKQVSWFFLKPSSLFSNFIHTCTLILLKYVYKSWDIAKVVICWKKNICTNIVGNLYKYIWKFGERQTWHAHVRSHWSIQELESWDIA